MDEALITIIVPVYKVEPYIRKCIDSILGQTYQQLEILLVDDGSPDNCGAICDEYAKKDGRITVIHKENGGLSSARNAALNLATGEYLMFVDSDDWVEPKFCEKTLRIAQEKDARVVSFGYNIVSADREGRVTNKQPRVLQKTGFMNASESSRHLILRDSPMGNYVWNKLYKQSLWENVRFPEGRLWEDQAVTYLMMLRAGETYISNSVLYNYLQRPGSIVNTMDFSPKMYTDLFTTWRERLPVIRQYCPENERYQIVQMADISVSNIGSIRHDAKNGTVLNEMKAFLLAHKNSLLHCEAKRTTRVMLYLYFYCRPLLPVIVGLRALRA